MLTKSAVVKTSRGNCDTSICEAALVWRNVSKADLKASEPLLSIPSTTNAVTSGCMRCCRGFVDAGLCISRSCTIFGDNSRSCSSREVAILCSRMWNSRQRSSICRQFTLRSACLEAGMSSSTLGRYLRSTDWASSSRNLAAWVLGTSDSPSTRASAQSPC